MDRFGQGVGPCKRSILAPPLRDSGMVWRDLFPTLKRGANIHCAYGALTGAIGNLADSG